MEDTQSTTQASPASADAGSTDVGGQSAQGGEDGSGHAKAPATAADRMKLAMAKLRAERGSVASPAASDGSVVEHATKSANDALAPAPGAATAHASAPTAQAVPGAASQEMDRIARLEADNQKFQQMAMAMMAQNQQLVARLSGTPQAAPQAQEQTQGANGADWEPSALVTSIAREKLGAGAPEWKVNEFARKLASAIAADHLSGAEFASDEYKASLQEQVGAFKSEAERWMYETQYNQQMDELRSKVEELSMAPVRQQAISQSTATIAQHLRESTQLRESLPTLADLATVDGVADEVSSLASNLTAQRVKGAFDEVAWNSEAGKVLRALNDGIAPMVETINGSDPSMVLAVAGAMKVGIDPRLHPIIDKLAAARAGSTQVQGGKPARKAKPAPLVQPGSTKAEYGGLQVKKKPTTLRARLDEFKSRYGSQ